MQQKGKTVRPKVPDRTQYFGEQAEKKGGPAQSAQQHIEPKPPLCQAHGEQKQSCRRTEAEQAVQQPRQPRPPQTQRPQQVVYHSYRHSQQNGLEKGRQLFVDKDAHISRTGG